MIAPVGKRTPEAEHARYLRRKAAGRAPRARSSGPSGPHALAPFIAIDGESLATGEYALLAASTGDTLTDRNGISTVRAFEWLLHLKELHPRSVFVAFGLNYDANMILRDVHRNKLMSLWDTNTCEWLSDVGIFYRIEWIPGKRFRVATGSRTNDSYRGFTISDVFGFFQSSFVNALDSWEIADDEGAIARVIEGKAGRGGFRWEDIDDVTRYCLAECRMLVSLMNRLREVFYSAGIRPQAWNGAGAAAAAVLKKHGIRDHHRPDEDLPRPLYRAILSAYFGGRSEVFLQGNVGDCIGYDINSAYPAVAATLPTLHGRWHPTRKYDPHARFAVWRVEWHIDLDVQIAPFPYRRRTEISYPVDGAGWYWQDEVAAAIALHGDTIRVVSGWVFEPESDAQPFAFVPEYFRLKAEAKAAGRAETKAYKLALNSLYGKLAQGIGHHGVVPWQRSYVWAGLITSGTRARLLQMAARAPDDVVFMATDGIVFRSDPVFATSNELGGVERSEYPNLFVAQSGIYVASDNAGREVFRCRGFFKREVDFDRIREGWRERGPHYYDAAIGSRFVGLGTALGRTDPPRWEVWRTWHEHERRMSLYPDRKYVDHSIADDIDTGAIPIPQCIRWVSPEGDASRISAPYRPKTTGLPDDADPEYVQAMEQPYPDDAD